MASSATVPRLKKAQGFSEYFHCMPRPAAIVTLGVPVRSVGCCCSCFPICPSSIMVEFSFFSKYEYIGRRTFVGLQTTSRFFTRKGLLSRLSLCLILHGRFVGADGAGDAVCHHPELQVRWAASSSEVHCTFLPLLRHLGGISFIVLLHHGFVLDTLLSWVGFMWISCPLASGWSTPTS